MDFFSYCSSPRLRVSSRRLLNWFCPRIYIESVLGEFPGYSWHVSWAPCEDFPALTEELDERAFLFWTEVFRHESGLGGVRRVDLMCSGVATGVELNFGSLLPCVRKNIMVHRFSDTGEFLLHAEELRDLVEVPVAVI